MLHRTRTHVATPSSRKKMGGRGKTPSPSDPSNALPLKIMIEHQRIMTVNKHCSILFKMLLFFIFRSSLMLILMFNHCVDAIVFGVLMYGLTLFFIFSLHQCCYPSYCTKSHGKSKTHKYHYAMAQNVNQRCCDFMLINK